MVCESIRTALHLRPGETGAFQVAAQKFQISPSMATEWWKKGLGYFDNKPQTKAITSFDTNARFPDLEVQFYAKFYTRRVHEGFYADGYWLRVEFEKLVTAANRDPENKFKHSNGGSMGFAPGSASLHNALQTKMPYLCGNACGIRSFHMQIIRLQVCRHQAAPDCNCRPLFGRFSPDRMVAADQIPLPFALVATDTLNPKGATSCFLRGMALEGLDKQQLSYYTAHRSCRW